MPQFDVYENTDDATRRAYPYFVDIQSDLLDTLNSRVAIPLGNIEGQKYPQTLCPNVELQGAAYVLLTHQLASVRAGNLGKPVGSLADQRDMIVAAIDLLVTGIRSVQQD